MKKSLRRKNWSATPWNAGCARWGNSRKSRRAVTPLACCTGLPSNQANNPQAALCYASVPSRDLPACATRPWLFWRGNAGSLPWVARSGKRAYGASRDALYHRGDTGDRATFLARAGYPAGDDKATAALICLNVAFVARGPSFKIPRTLREVAPVARAARYDLRRLGCWSERGHFLAGAVEACIAAQCPEAGRSSTAAGRLLQRALAPSRLCHRPLRAGHGTARRRGRESVDRRHRLL
jgi:hypothetical protein